MQILFCGVSRCFGSIGYAEQRLVVCAGWGLCFPSEVKGQKVRQGL